MSTGTLDGGHGVLVYWYGKNPALALWGSGPAFGMDSNMLLSWHKYGGGKELLDGNYASLNMNVVSFPYGPMPTEPLGWYKKPIQSAADFQGLKFRTVGLGIEVYTAMGAAVNALPGSEIVPALDRGLIDAAEFNNPSSDRALDFTDVSKIYMMQSFHKSAETFEILLNKAKYDALSDQLKSIVAGAVEASSANMSWKAVDRYSQDYIDIQEKDNVKVYKTPDDVLQEQLKIWDQAAPSGASRVVSLANALPAHVLTWSAKTESAAIGAAGAFLLAIQARTLNWQRVKESVFLTAKTTAMVCWLFVGSALFSAVFALLGGQQLVEEWVLSLNMSPVQFMLLSQAIIFVLGWPLEWTEIIVIFVPIFLPLLKHFNIDPILWGTLVFVNLQAAFLSPPVAMSAFYLKGVSPPHVTINQIFAGMMPYMLVVILCMVIMYVWPGMTLWLPNYLYGN